MGPAIGGLILSQLGVSVVFAINSVCFLVLMLAVSRWKSLREASRVPLKGVVESLTSALCHIGRAPGVRAVVIRVSLFSLFISMIPALLPVVGLKQLNLNGSQLGLLFTRLSSGAVLGVVLIVPTVRRKFSPNQVTIVATALLILVYFLMGCIRQPQAFLLVAGVAGVAWTVVASELWVAGQIATPELARGRLTAAYMIASNGSTAIGGIVWGALAAFKGLEFTLHTASILLLISLPLLSGLSHRL